MRFTFSLLLALSSLALFSCEKSSPTNIATVYRHQVFNYSFNRGQVRGKPAYYKQRSGLDSMWARLTLDEMPLQQTRIEVALYNAPEGTGFPVNVRQVDTTYWGYDYAPDAAVFSTVMAGKGLGSMTVDTFLSLYSYDYLITKYDGYFVVQDPITPDTTSRQIDTFSSAVFPVFGTFAR